MTAAKLKRLIHNIKIWKLKLWTVNLIPLKNHFNIRYYQPTVPQTPLPFINQQPRLVTLVQFRYLLYVRFCHFEEEPFERRAKEKCWKKNLEKEAAPELEECLEIHW